MHYSLKKMVAHYVVSMFCLFAVLLIPLSHVFAEPEYGTVTTERLKKMMDEKTVFTLIDARTKEEYDEAHIVKAINIPEKRFEELVSLLPADKTSLLVIYCNGVKCGKSKKLAKRVNAVGYVNITLYNEGFPVWEERNLQIAAGPDYGKKIETTKLKPAEMKQLIGSSRQDYVLVDVRDESEFKEGHIPTAINIPVETFASKQDILPKDRKVIVYCNTGGRSYTAYRKLIKMAYPQIYQTLFAEWREAGMSIEK